MLPDTPARVPRHTAAGVNRRIARETAARLEWCASAGPEAIEDRLEELDAERDIERTLEANASSLVLLGSALGALWDRRFLLLPAAVSAFLLQHALQGWCPPVPVLRRMGFRTQSEIEDEPHALKALRGDFASADGALTAREALEAVRR